MTNLKKIDCYIAGAGIVLTGAAYLLMGMQFAFETFAGVFIAFVNWVLFTRAGFRIAASGGGAIFVLFLVIKTVTILAIIVLILLKTAINPVAFMVGFSALASGITVFALSDALLRGDRLIKKDSGNAP
jgi:hypothetical protein